MIITLKTNDISKSNNYIIPRYHIATRSLILKNLSINDEFNKKHSYCDQALQLAIDTSKEILVVEKII